MSRLGNVGGRLYRGEVSVNFVGRKRTWYSISGAILLISIVALLVRGLDFSVDFKGGAVFQFAAPSASTTQVQDAVTGGGVTGAIVQELSGSLGKSWQVQTPALSSAQSNTVENSLISHLGVNASKISVQFVGSSWGSRCV